MRERQSKKLQELCGRQIVTNFPNLFYPRETGMWQFLLKKVTIIFFSRKNTKSMLKCGNFKQNWPAPENSRDITL